MHDAGSSSARPAHWPAGRRQSVSLQRSTAAAAAPAASAAAAAQAGDEIFAADARPVILFDGVCNLCNGGVNFMLDWDREGLFRFAALQSDAGRELLVRSGRHPTDISSIVLVEQEASFIKADAVLRIAQSLQAPLPLVAAALGSLPRLVKDPVYDVIAGNRYTIFGRSNSCRLSDARFSERFIST